MDKDCIFCKIVNKEIKSEFVYEDDKFIAILDLHPKSIGHTLIIPKDHFRNLLDMPETLGPELLVAIKEVSLKLIKDGKGEGVNVIVNNEPSAGQVVMHSHVHIIPRKNGDGLKGIV
jgi:histidine triad (HIT) family protein